MKFVTSRGSFVVEVNRAWAPYSADRFYELVKLGYFEDVRFYDVADKHHVGFGIHGHPAVNSVWMKRRILDDLPRYSNQAGLVSFASVGPMTRSTRMIVNLTDNPALDGQGFDPFAAVTSGFQVLEDLYAGYGPSAPHASGPRLEQMLSEGNDYLTRAFPKLDYIKSASFVR